MSLDALIALTCHGDIREILFFSQILEGGGDVGLEVVPLQAKLLREGYCTFSPLWLPQDWINSLNSHSLVMGESWDGMTYCQAKTKTLHPWTNLYKIIQGQQWGVL